MKVFITGSRGLLGSALVPYLQKCGFDLICHSRSEGCDVCADLTDIGQVNITLNSVMPEVIVNLAALTSIEACELNPNSAYLANVKIVNHLVNWIKDRGNSCHLIHLSTDHVYDGVGLSKEDDVILRNYYGFSKYAGEIVACSVSSTVLRTNFFGPSQSPTRISFSDWILESLKQEHPITVFDDVCFTPLSLQYLVELLVTLIVRQQKGIFNIGSAGVMSKADFAFAFAETLKLPTRYLIRGTSNMGSKVAVRPKNMSMNSFHFEDTFGIQLPTLRDEIKTMKDAYANATR